MVTTTLSPENYRAFRINELLRDFIFTDAINRGGFVYAKMPVGAEFIAAVADKLNRELDEAHAEDLAANLPELATEAGDILDVADLALHHMGPTGKLVGRPPLGVTKDKLTFLQRHAMLPSLPAGHAGEFLRRTIKEVQGYVSRAYINGGHALGRKAVKDARTAKNAAKGRHNGWYGLAIILPRDDEWCPTFAAKYEEIEDLSQFNIDMSLTLDHFPVTRASG